MLKSYKDFKDASKVFKVAREKQELESHRQLHLLVEKIQSQGWFKMVNFNKWAHQRYLKTEDDATFTIQHQGGDC